MLCWSRSGKTNTWVGYGRNHLWTVLAFSRKDWGCHEKSLPRFIELEISKIQMRHYCQTNCLIWIWFSRIVGWSTMLQAWRSQVWFPMMLFDFSFDYGHGVDSAFNRNKYQESSWGVNKWLPACKADTLTHPHLWADYLENMGTLRFHNPVGLHYLLQG
jgi:hypothetical protein